MWLSSNSRAFVKQERVYVICLDCNSLVKSDRGLTQNCRLGCTTKLVSCCLTFLCEVFSIKTSSPRDRMSYRRVFPQLSLVTKVSIFHSPCFPFKQVRVSETPGFSFFALAL